MFFNSFIASFCSFSEQEQKRLKYFCATPYLEDIFSSYIFNQYLVIKKSTVFGISSFSEKIELKSSFNFSLRKSKVT